MRELSCISVLIVVVFAPESADANPIPAPDNDMNVYGQTVDIKMNQCEGDPVSAWRVPTASSPEPFSEYSCPMKCGEDFLEPAEAIHIETKYCEAWVEGDPDFSPGEYRWGGGVCLTDTCVPLGRWKYVMLIDTSYSPSSQPCMFSLVVEVTNPNPSCPVLPEPTPEQVTIELVTTPDQIVVDSENADHGASNHDSTNLEPSIETYGSGVIPDSSIGKGCNAVSFSNPLSLLIVLVCMLGVIFGKRWI